MSAPATRATVDFDRSQVVSHPRLALVLALLAIPGVTIAWDLPAGGFYTGVPLAIAAIVLGARARPGRMATTAIVIGVGALAFVAACMAVFAA